jgi:hypothetical protein
MAKLLKATVEIRGTRPLLWHHFGPDAIPLEKTEKEGVAGNQPNEWKSTVLMTTGRQLYLLPAAIFSCIREAARYTKKGKGTLQISLSATLQVVDDRILVNRKVPKEPLPTDPCQPVYLHVSSVRNPVTKGRNVRYRVACSKSWVAHFQIVWDATIVSRSEMEAMVRNAGSLVGLGDGRSIGLGRFDMRSFKVLES